MVIIPLPDHILDNFLQHRAADLMRCQDLDSGIKIIIEECAKQNIIFLYSEPGDTPQFEFMSEQHLNWFTLKYS